MTKDSSNRYQVVELILPWIVFAILAAFTYVKFVRIPYVGFEFSGRRVTEIYPSISQETLQVGDELLMVGKVVVGEFLENLHLTIFDQVNTGDIVSLVVSRDGRILHIDWVIPGPDRIQLLQRFNSQWWLSYVFWIAGVATLLFIHPKDTRWKLMIAFNFLTAIWLGAGSGPSHWHIWKSGFILNSTIWLCVPVYLHFHWYFPSNLKRLPNLVWGLLYFLGISLAISEWFQILPKPAFYGGFIAALAGSGLLLITHAISQKEYRRDIRSLGSAFLLMLLPSLGVALVSMFGFDLPGFVSGGSLLALPALPGAYFFVAYRRQFLVLDQRMKRLIRTYFIVIFMGTIAVTLLSLANLMGSLREATLITGIFITLIAAISAITGFSPFLALPALTGEKIFLNANGEMEIRANRLLSLYLFAILVGFILSVGTIISDSLVSFPGEITITGIAAATLGSVITAIGFSPFQRFVDRHILGIQLHQEELLNIYADRITTCLDHQSLIQLLRDELLPSLLVRQSVLLQMSAGGMKPFVKLGVDASQIPVQTNIPNLMNQASKLLGSAAELPESSSWIRVILPLQIGGESIGLWLLGRRDPDDFYAQSDISVLETLANQTAIALVNIEQTKLLHTLYQANIDLHEEERTAFARDIHDDVLARLAILSTQSYSTDSDEFQNLYQQVTAQLRQILFNLRPAMLNFGLFTAMDECIDDLSERSGDQVTITMSVPVSHVRYDPKIEEHLYRIVQQACENAYRHANAAHIRVHGSLEPESVHLVVEDDGMGFELARLDFNTLLVEKHFGLVGMIERAAIINAELKFFSEPGRGFRVILNWISRREAREV